MRVLLLISFLSSLLLTSCGGMQMKDMKALSYQPIKETVQNTYFNQIGEEHIFRANLKIAKNELSGLFVVKRINDSLHRVVLTSDFGNTLFDFSIYPTGHEVNYVMKDLDRKIILNTLASDFSYLVANTFEIEGVAEVPEQLIYKGKFQKHRTLVVQNKENKAVERVLRTSKRKIKVSYDYTSTSKDELLIQHYNFPLTISLTPFVE